MSRLGFAMVVAGSWAIVGCQTSGDVRSGTEHELQPVSKKRVLILCTGNSCRSQMAEAFWRQHGGDAWDVYSAGSKPSGHVYPLAIQAMAEKGIDISKHQSKSVEPFVDQSFDVVVTVCDDAATQCPTFRQTTTVIHHGFDDPPKYPGTPEEKLAVTRRVRDEIEAKVKAWLAQVS